MSKLFVSIFLGVSKQTGVLYLASIPLLLFKITSLLIIVAVHPDGNSTDSSKTM